MKLGIFLSSAAIALLAGCAAPSHTFDRADAAKPDFFPILPWDPLHGWDGHPVEDRSNALQGIADCHFNMAGFVLPKDLPQCQALGLGAIMLTTDPAFTNVQYIYDWKKLSDGQIDQRVKQLVEGSGKNPSIVGYFITDEPGAADFPALGKAVAAVKKYAPGKLAYINLFPNYATLGAPDTSQLGAASYEEYLEKFIAEVNPQFLSYDNYMVQYSMDMRDEAAAANYYYNLLDVRRVALKHHLPCLNIVASCQLQKEKAAPTLENLMFQAYTTLAAGYRGVTWYTYFGDAYAHAPLDKAGKPTPVWTDLQEVNSQIAALAPVLSKLTSTGVYFSSPAPVDQLQPLPGKLIQSVASETPVMVGEFRDAGGAGYAMIVNLSLKKSARLSVKTISPAKAAFLISSRNGSATPFSTGQTIWLTPGRGALLSLGK